MIRPWNAIRQAGVLISRSSLLAIYMASFAQIIGLSNWKQYIVDNDWLIGRQ